MAGAIVRGGVGMSDDQPALPTLLHGTLRAAIYDIDKINSFKLFTKSGTLPQKVARTVLFQMKRLCSCNTQFTGTRLYATVDLDKVRVGRTRPVHSVSHPKWSENLTIYCAHMAAEIIFTVKDDNPIGATLLGRAKVPVADIMNGRQITRLVDIYDENKNPIGSKIHVSLQFFNVNQDENWSKGVKAPRLDLVPRTFFKQRQGCKVTLYNDAHLDDKFLLDFEGATGVPYEPHRCWVDIFNAITNAKHFIYIAGWSVYHKISLVRDPNMANLTLGELLRRKAADGVRVLVLVWDDRTSSTVLKKDGIMATHDENTFEYFRNTMVNCVKCPRTTERAQSILQGYEVDAMFTHHQKTIIVDGDHPSGSKRQIVSFVGGIDLCDGRYDTQEHPLFRTLKTVHKDDFHQPNFDGASIKKGGPREPWHDIHCRIEGPAAWDVLYNFEQRWAKQVKRTHKPGLLTTDELDRIDPNPSEPITPSSDPHTWNVQIFRSIDSGAAFGHSPNIDLDKAAAAGLINEKDNLVERSIQDAYICAIRRAKNFIYIENQYFLGSSYGWKPDIKLDEVGALHLIPKELSLKIVSNIKAGKHFSVYVVIPMWPEGPPKSEAVQAILDWQRRTMEMMYTDIAEAIKEKDLDTKPSDYLSFFCLGNKEKPQPGEDNPEEKPPQDSDYARAQQSRRFMIYVHAKMMIVDDEYIIIGSANINQRSMDGERDTEIAMGAYQPYHLMTSESPRGGEVFKFRMAVWYEHLRKLEPSFSRPETISCMHDVNKLAKKNWEVYMDDNHFEDLPCHLLPYPVKFEENGTSWSMKGSIEYFPDTMAPIIGKKSDILPAILTT